MTEKQIETCLSCKIISVGCLLGVGGYLIYQGRMQSSASKYILYVLGSGITGLGIGEIFDKSPFRDKN